MWRLTVCLMICVTLGVCSCKYKTDQAMKNAQIVPDVIPVAPQGLIHVDYPSGVKAELGNELTPTQVKDQPSVKWNAEHNSFYTLCLTDPDVSNRTVPTGREFQHWLVGNVPGGDVDKGDSLSAYVGSGPPQKTGLHRYVFLVYKQPSKLTFDEPRVNNRTFKNRQHFSINKFASKYNLGTPVAGNFYEAQYDDYVPILHQQLGVH